MTAPSLESAIEILTGEAIRLRTCDATRYPKANHLAAAIDVVLSALVGSLRTCQGCGAPVPREGDLDLTMRCDACRAKRGLPPQVDLMLPCPFCGAAAGLILERHPQSGGGGHRCVRCGECGAIGPASRTQAGAAGEREATANWNRRVEGRGKR